MKLLYIISKKLIVAYRQVLVNSRTCFLIGKTGYATSIDMGKISIGLNVTDNSGLSDVARAYVDIALEEA